MLPVSGLLLLAAVSSTNTTERSIKWVAGTNDGLYRAFLQQRGVEHNNVAAGEGSCSASLSSFPLCRQKCGMWCWATVIAETRWFYDDTAPHCGPDKSAECTIVGETRGEDCCTAGCTGTCAGGATVSTIQNQLAKLIPKQKFTLTGALSEADLTAALKGGKPVLRITSGHIDVVTGCSGGNFTVTDSEYDQPFSAPYSSLVQSPYNPLAKWVQSLVPQ